MIKLYQFPPAWGLPNPSSFCMKVEVFMRMAKIPYEVEIWRDPRKAPKGKLPMIEHEGRLIPDSRFCVDYLTETFEVPLDAHLTAEEKAIGFALQSMLEEHFYWALVYNRWIDQTVWPVVRDQFFGFMPFPLRVIVPMLIRRDVKAALHGQGMGRHAENEIYFLAGDCLRAVSDLLGDRPFILGDRPTSFDATTYASIANAALVPFDTELQRTAKALPNLLGYCERMKDRYFPAIT